MDECADAFNRGCDARLQGLPMSANPYPRVHKMACQFWRQGWWHVDWYWGAAAKWPVKELPLVLESA